MPPTVYLLSSFFPQPVKNSLSARKLMSRNTFAVYVVFLHFGICRCYPFCYCALSCNFNGVVLVGPLVWQFSVNNKTMKNSL